MRPKKPLRRRLLKRATCLGILALVAASTTPRYPLPSLLSSSFGTGGSNPVAQVAQGSAARSLAASSSSSSSYGFLRTKHHRHHHHHRHHSRGDRRAVRLSPPHAIAPLRSPATPPPLRDVTLNAKIDLKKLAAAGGLAAVMSVGLGGVDFTHFRPAQAPAQTPAEEVILNPFVQLQQRRQTDELSNLRKLQTTDQEMIKKLESQISPADRVSRPIVENLNRNLEAERRATLREKGMREKLKLELRLNRISQVSLGLALTAFIAERQRGRRLQKQNDERQRVLDETLNEQNDEGLLSRLINKADPVAHYNELEASGELDLPRNRTIWDAWLRIGTASSESRAEGSHAITHKASSSSAVPSSDATSRAEERPWWKKGGTVVEKVELPTNPPVAEEEAENRGWWRAVKGFTGGVFTRAKGTIKKRVGTIIERRPEKKSTSSRIPPRRESVMGTERRSIFERASVRLRQAVSRDEHAGHIPSGRHSSSPVKIPNARGTEKSVVVNNKKEKEKLSRDSEEKGTIQVRIWWKSPRTFWSWRPLSTVNVQIRGAFFLKFQVLVQGIVSNTGMFQGFEEGLNKLITWSVARRLYANPVDQKVSYAYQVLRGDLKGPIIPLPKYEEIEQLEKAVERGSLSPPPPLETEKTAVTTLAGEPHGVNRTES